MWDMLQLYKLHRIFVKVHSKFHDTHWECRYRTDTCLHSPGINCISWCLVFYCCCTNFRCFNHLCTANYTWRFILSLSQIFLRWSEKRLLKSFEVFLHMFTQTMLRACKQALTVFKLKTHVLAEKFQFLWNMVARSIIHLAAFYCRHKIIYLLE